MKIHAMQVGPIMTNCYLLCDEENGVCACIDPGGAPERVDQAIADTGCELAAIYLTHGHFDHCNGVRGLVALHPDVPVYISEKDVTDENKGNYSLLFFRLPEHNQRYYGEGDQLTLGSLQITVMETPGHTPGSVCYLERSERTMSDRLTRCPKPTGARAATGQQADNII